MRPRSDPGYARGLRTRTDPIYQAFYSMRSRCISKRPKSYRVYAGRGIAICDRWRSYDAFLADMGPSWFSGATLDRIDNDGGYSPDNCRWATRVQQGQNTRANVRVPYQGEMLTLSEAARRSGIDATTLNYRAKHGRELFVPVRRAAPKPPPKPRMMVDTPLGPMNPVLIELIYGVPYASIKLRHERGITWREGLLNPPHHWTRRPKA